jgi:leader peptidase (prepilin peptidase)/N-methyltransferase
LAAIALIGLAVGSFLNVVIYRVPRGESLVSPGSHCPRCSTELRARDNVPVISWLVLRGRCAFCSARISVRYPLVEAGTAVLFVAIAARLGLSPQLPAYLYLAAVIVVLALIDLDLRMLPDSIVVPSYVVSLLLLAPAAAAGGGLWTIERGIIGMLSLLALFFCLALAAPMAVHFEDVKLAGLLGLYLAWLSWSVLLVGAGAMLLLALGSRTTISYARTRRDAGAATVAVPFGMCVLGTGVLMLIVTTAALPLPGGLPG